jgi:hypothetical protein
VVDDTGDLWLLLRGQSRGSMIEGQLPHAIRPRSVRRRNLPTPQRLLRRRLQRRPDDGVPMLLLGRLISTSGVIVEQRRWFDVRVSLRSFARGRWRSARIIAISTRFRVRGVTNPWCCLSDRIGPSPGGRAAVDTS